MSEQDRSSGRRTARGRRGPRRIETLIGAILMVAGCTTTAISDRPFSGLNQPLEEKDTVNLLIVHGMGIHCVGYAQTLINGLTQELGYKPKTRIRIPEKGFNEETCVNDYRTRSDVVEEKYSDGSATQEDAICQELGEQCQVMVVKQGQGDDATYELYGFIRTLEFGPRNVGSDTAGKTLRVYELTWDLMTRWAKRDYVLKVDEEFGFFRHLFNRAMKKDIVNNSFSDAVLYVGAYKQRMRLSILYAFCKIIDDGTSVIGTGHCGSPISPS